MSSQAQQEAPVLDQSDTKHRFTISSALRAAENEMDEVHGKWLLCQKRNGELTRDLRAANERIVALEKQLAVIPKAAGKSGK